MASAHRWFGDNMTMYDLDRSFSQRLHYKFHSCFCLFKILADKNCWSLSLIASNCSHWASTKGWEFQLRCWRWGAEGKDSERVLYTFTKGDGEIQAMDNVQSSHRCLDPLHGLYESPSHRHLVYSFGSVWAFSDPFLGLLQCRTMTKTVSICVNGGFSSDPADLIILNPYSIWVENHVHPTQWRTTSRFGDPNLGRSWRLFPLTNWQGTRCNGTTPCRWVDAWRVEESS